MNRIRFLVLCCLFAAPPLHAQGSLPAPRATGVAVADDSLAARVDALFAEWDRTTSPGAALAVIKDGEIVYRRGYGMANLEYGAPVRPSTIFHIASISKHFTAFAVGLLEEEGKLSLDDDVRRFVPELPDFGRTLTLRQLIHHTSGLRDQWELLAMSGWRLDDVITREHILKTLSLQRELNFEPGEEYLYSNSGYTLLAVVVERVSGMPFGEFTRKRIFAPLGMESTHFHEDHEMIVPGRAYSYAPVPAGGFRNAPLNYANAGATSLFTTVEDLAKWDRNFTEARVGTPDLLRRMLSQGVLNSGKTITYAHGLVVDEYRGLKTVSHGGADAGYRSYYLRFPDQGYSFVVFSNLSSFNPGRLAQQVADLYLDGAFTRPAAPTPPAEKTKAAKLSARELEARAGLYVSPKTDVVRRLEARDGKLMLATGPGYELIPLDGRRHRVAGTPTRVEISFEPASRGGGLRLREVVGSGEPDFYEPAVTLAPEQMAEFAGTYASEELGTRYELRVRDGKLVAVHRRHEDIALSPTLTDRFGGNRWYFQTLRFQRDEQGRISGFLLTGGRVRNLRFDRVGD